MGGDVSIGDRLQRKSLPGVRLPSWPTSAGGARYAHDDWSVPVWSPWSASWAGGTGASAAPRLTPACWAHWDFSEGAGSVLHDRTGNGYDGKQINNAVWAGPNTARALQFDGDGD